MNKKNKEVNLEIIHDIERQLRLIDGSRAKARGWARSDVTPWIVSAALLLGATIMVLYYVFMNS